MEGLDNLFDLAQINFDEEPKKEKEIEPKTKTKLKKQEAKEHKEEIKEDTENNSFEKDKLIKKLQEELEEEKSKNTIRIDLNNTDDRKTLKELINEGKIIVSKKDKPFIVTDIPTFGANKTKAPAHTIYCEDIVHVDYRRYYLDLCDMPNGKRTKAYDRIWVFHKGYSTYDLIDEKLYDYLLDNGFVPQINYCHIDLSNGVAINTDDKNEPDEEIVKQEIERMNKAIDKLNSKKIVDKLDEN